MFPPLNARWLLGRNCVLLSETVLGNTLIVDLLDLFKLTARSAFPIILILSILGRILGRINSSERRPPCIQAVLIGDQVSQCADIDHGLVIFIVTILGFLVALFVVSLVLVIVGLLDEGFSRGGVELADCFEDHVDLLSCIRVEEQRVLMHG